MKLGIIVAAAKNNAIGKDNKMLWHLPDDFKFFKKTTMGCPMIMGRKTFESIGKPLPGRLSVIVTRNKDYAYEGCEVVNSLEEALELLKDKEKVFVIGGGEIYQQAMPLADELYITKVEVAPEADTFFPEVDESDWESRLVEAHGVDERHTYSFEIYAYERIKA